MRSKIIFLFLISCLAFSSARSQQIIDGRYYGNINSWYRWQGGSFINNLNIPKVTATTGRDTGAVRYSIIDSSIYVWTGSQWRQVGSGGAGSSYTAGVGVKIDGSAIRFADTIAQNHTIRITDGFDFYLLGGSATNFNRIGVGSINQLYSENTVTGRYTEIYNNSTAARMRNFNAAGATADIAVYGGYGNMNSFSSGNNTNLNVYPGYWELKTDDTGFPTTLGLDMKGTKDSVTVKTYAGAGIFSFYSTSMKAFKNVNYNTYDSSGYTSLTHIPKQYLEDRLAGFSGGGGGSTDTTSLSNRIDDKVSKTVRDTTRAAKILTSDLMVKGPLMQEQVYSYVNPQKVGAVNGADTLIIPTYDGSGQTVHPDVWHTPNGWNGYKWWMVMTPYRNGVDSLENPSLLASHDGVTWVVPPGITNPISPSINYTTGFHSDPEIIPPGSYDDSMRIIYRHTLDRTTNGSRLYVQSFAGTTVSSRTMSIDSSATEVIVSPAVIERNNEYIMYYVELKANANVVLKRTATNPNGPWSSPDTVTIANSTGLDFWHLNVNTYGNQVHMWLTMALLNGTGQDARVYFASSDDGETFTMKSTPTLNRPESLAAWDKAGIYRTSAVLVDGKEKSYRLYYSGVSNATRWNMGITNVNLNKTDSLNVGVATAAYPLDVQDSTTSSDINLINFKTPNLASNGKMRILFGKGAGLEGFYFQYFHNSSNSLRRFGISPSEGSTPPFTMLANGNFGFGTETPDERITYSGKIKSTSGVNEFVGTLRANDGFNAVVLQDGAGNQAFRALRGTTAWADAVSTQFFQVGTSTDNVLFTGASGGTFNRVGFSTSSFHVNTAFGSTAPVGLFDISSGSTKLFNVTSGGQVGIGNSSPAASAKLDIVSTTQGVLLPRMTKTQRDAISSPATGLMVYQTDNTPGLRVWNGTNWMRYTETAD
jgi:hypothetical protein